MRKISPIVLLLLLLAGWWWWQKPAAQDPVSRFPVAVAAAESALPAARASESSALLPPEAQRTLTLIGRGGPFPHPQDDGVFGNREGRLPKQPHGYYREYTVESPGISHRGGRRIVTGGRPPVTYYYTDDHYDSFRRFTVSP